MTQVRLWNRQAGKCARTFITYNPQKFKIKLLGPYFPKKCITGCEATAKKVGRIFKKGCQNIRVAFSNPILAAISNPIMVVDKNPILAALAFRHD